MADMISLESFPASGDGNRLLHSGRDRHQQGVVRLLDTMPWWALLVVAVLTFLFLHKLAGFDVEHLNQTGVMEAAASQVIIKILAGGCPYFFPPIPLREEAGGRISSHAHVCRRVR